MNKYKNKINLNIPEDNRTQHQKDLDLKIINIGEVIQKTNELTSIMIKNNVCLPEEFVKFINLLINTKEKLIEERKKSRRR